MAVKPLLDFPARPKLQYGWIGRGSGSAQRQVVQAQPLQYRPGQGGVSRGQQFQHHPGANHAGNIIHYRAVQLVFAGKSRVVQRIQVQLERF